MKKILLTLLFAGVSLSQDLITLKSKYSVDKTTLKVTKELKERGYYIFDIINHPKHIRKNAKEDIDEESQTILFDKPKATKHMYTFNSSVMLEVPFRIAIYKNIDDEVFISYKSVDTIIKDHDMQECKFLQKKLRKDLYTVTTNAIK